MQIHEAANIIARGVSPAQGTWADVGAGTGVFTLALRALLQPGSKVLAVDKNPHSLWSLPLGGEVPIQVEEADFTRPMALPMCQGIVMANALHYAEDPGAALGHVLKVLEPGANLILVEYDTEQPNPPWVPYPVSFKQFGSLCETAGLSAPELLHRHRSVYGPHDLYVAVAALKG